MTTRREFTKTISIGSFGALALGATSCVSGEEKTGKPASANFNSIRLFVRIFH